MFNLETKTYISVYIDYKIAKLFEKNRGVYVKSRLIQYWIEEFLSNNPNFVPKLIKKPLEKSGDSSKGLANSHPKNNKGVEV